MKSMTGFGSSNIRTQDLEIDVSLKSYNGRFLDLRVHMPREYEAFEGEVKKRLSKKFQRGTISVYVNRKLGAGSKLMKVTTDVALAKKIKTAFNKLNKELSLDGDVGLEQFLRWNEVIKIGEESRVSSQEKAKLLSALDKAIIALDKERSREGKQLASDLKSHGAKLLKVVSSIDSLSSQTKKGIKEKIKKRIKALDVSVDIDPQRLAQEAALQADRMDISEEIVRLKAHISAYNKEISSSGVKGKKLDFYTQELLREVNTIASKSSYAKISHLSVDAKSIIEKIKEQVQNLE